MRRISAVFTAVSLVLSTAVVSANPLEFNPIAQNSVKLDGRLTEWTVFGADQVVKSSSATASFGIGYDDNGIWVAAQVTKDGALVRTDSFGANEDCVSLVLAFPKPGGGYSAYEVGFYPGVSGASAGTVKFRAGGSGKIDGAKIVEATRKTGGYDLEAYIPWTAFAESKTTRAGLRASMRVYDSSGSSIRGIKATGTGSVDAPKDLEFLMNPAEQAVLSALAGHSLGWKDIKNDIVADFVGSDMYERALFTDRVMFLIGPTYRKGTQFYSTEFGEIVSVKAQDVSGDGKSDLLITTRTHASTLRDALTVWTITGGQKGSETPEAALVHEVRIEGSGGALLSDNVVFSGTSATISYNPAKGWTQSTYKEATTTSLDPILLPWGTVKERKYSFDSNKHKFTLDRETPQNTVVPTAAPPPPPPPKPVATAAPTTESGLDKAIALYKKKYNLADSAAPKFSASVRMGSKPARVLIFGRQVVLATSEGYSSITLNRIASENDFTSLTVKELTGDSSDEVIIRGASQVKATINGTDKQVRQEIVLVYSLSSGQLNQIFSAEVARNIDDSRIESSINFTESSGSKAGRIEVSKGSARGWTEQTYPFKNESAPSGLEPMVLPWSNEKVVYQWNGDKFAR